MLWWNVCLGSCSCAYAFTLFASSELGRVMEEMSMVFAGPEDEEAESLRRASMSRGTACHP